MRNITIADVEVDTIKYRTMEAFYIDTVIDSTFLDKEGFIIDPRQVLKESKRFGMPETMIDEEEIPRLGRKAL